jgi:hypothetical protein
MHPYIIVLGSDIGSRIDVQQYLDTIEEIEYWFSSLPNCIFCVSSLDAHQIADKMKDYFGRKQFLVMECHPNRQGWLPRRAWEMMRTPDHFSSQATHQPYRK